MLIPYIFVGNDDIEDYLTLKEAFYRYRESNVKVMLGSVKI